MTNDTKKNMTLAAPETQRQRWMKYGANVVLSSLVVILLAAMLTWIGRNRMPMRFDTTVGGTQSLRPQSVNFIQDLKQPIRIVALYPQLKSDSHEQDYYQPVADLLNEYADQGQEHHDRVARPGYAEGRFQQAGADVTNKYGGAVQGYKAFLDNLPDATKPFDQFVTDEAANSEPCRLINSGPAASAGNFRGVSDAGSGPSPA